MTDRTRIFKAAAMVLLATLAGCGAMQQFAVSVPEPVTIQETGPKRFFFNNVGFGVDPAPAILTNPKRPWVYVEEEFELTLHGLMMWVEAGEYSSDGGLRITDVEVDYGDGQTETYAIKNEDEQMFAHPVFRHYYLKNGRYLVKATLTDNKKNKYHKYLQLLAVDPDSEEEIVADMEDLVRQIVDEVMKSSVGDALKEKNVVVFDMGGGEVPKSRRVNQMIENEMIEQFNKQGVQILERDHEVLRRWSPEVFGIVPNIFNRFFDVETVEEWAQFGEKLSVEAARPNYIIEYRLAKLARELDPAVRWNPVLNRWVSVEYVGTMDTVEDAIAEYSAVKSFEIDQLSPLRRKLIMKIYVRVIDVSQGIESTKVVFSKTHERTDEAYVVMSEKGGTAGKAQANLRRGGSMKSETASGQHACPHCGTLLGDFYDPITKEKVSIKTGDMVQCESCKKVFEVK